MRKVHFILPFIVLLGLIISLEDTYTALSLSAAVIFHELGHILMIKLLGGTLVKSELYGVGANINYYLKKRTNAKEILVSSAGPLFGFICANIGNYFSFELFYNFSISLCLINLLPVLPLDGGNIIRSILYFDKHDIFIHTISIVVGIVMSILGTFICFKTGNFSIVVLGLCIITTIITEITLQE